MSLIGALCTEAPVAPVADVIVLVGLADSVTCDDGGFDETRDPVTSLGGVVVKVVSPSPLSIELTVDGEFVVEELTVDGESVVEEGAQSVGFSPLL